MCVRVAVRLHEGTEVGLCGPVMSEGEGCHGPCVVCVQVGVTSTGSREAEAAQRCVLRATFFHHFKGREARGADAKGGGRRVKSGWVEGWLGFARKGKVNGRKVGDKGV